MVTSFKFGAVIAMLFMAGACTTLRDVPDWQNSLHQGDRVRIATRMYDSKVEMKLSEVTPDALRGWNRRHTALSIIPADQIENVQRRQFSMLKTTGLVIGITGVVYVIAYAAATASLAAAL